jgi:hypothetical protein
VDLAPAVTKQDGVTVVRLGPKNLDGALLLPSDLTWDASRNAFDAGTQCSDSHGGIQNPNASRSDVE